MATYVLVGGAWLGSWAWQRVVPLMEAAGHRVWTPSLTGLGEQAHRGTPEVGLETHVADVTNLLETADLRDVVLVGHSYAGMVTGSVAHRMPERLRRLVFLAAAIPRDGCGMLDDWSPEGRAWLEQQAHEQGDGWRWPFPETEVRQWAPDLCEEDLEFFRARAVGHPLKTLSDPARLGNPAAEALSRVYVACTLEEEGLPPVVAAGVASGAWQVERIATGHWPMLTAPRELAALFDRLA